VGRLSLHFGRHAPARSCVGPNRFAAAQRARKAAPRLEQFHAPCVELAGDAASHFLRGWHMKMSARLLGAAVAAGALLAGGTARAEGAFSGSVTLTSDYVFRGISQSDGAAAIQGSLDYSNGIFYAGLWGSSVNFGAVGPTDLASMELDAYVGVKPTTGPVNWDLGVIGYFYPNSTDLVGEFDYYEGKVAASISPADGFTLGAAVFYSPDFFAETGDAYYVELNGSYAFSDAFSVSAAYGNQDVDLIGDYDTWSVGAKYAYAGFTFGLTYSDSEAFDEGFVFDETLSDGRFVLSVGRAL
jgi:uncharacterized protein (TIGR02001 family)